MTGMHRPTGRYRRSQHRQSMTFRKLVIDTPLRQLSPTTNFNFRHFCTVRRSQPEINIGK